MGNPDQANSIADCSFDTLRLVAGLLEASSSMAHCIYREAELDDLIRQIEAEERDDRSGQAKRLLAAVFEAHGMVANQDPQAAAARLRAAIDGV
jgi:hypothetical protein